MESSPPSTGKGPLANLAAGTEASVKANFDTKGAPLQVLSVQALKA